ncbi:tyrosine-type recombinase/integrase [Limnoglobus roseus]|uniref:Site-specific integrase n=1 Tax=Limnoglobus roseus TaxID=2598579 RepID=A0A5C1AMY9_9BACT|nr:tyrosine-type recombinase/integrase [Limnoglobus roseus]QEL19092.1 site-specific integrase [Limnoglobus roseus]
MRLPTYCRHKATNQAYVTVRRGDKREVIYLGVYGSAESRRLYAEVIANLGSPASPKPPRLPAEPSPTPSPSATPPATPTPSPSSSPTVGACFDRWAAICRNYYRLPDGRVSREVEDHHRSWEPLVTLHRDRPIGSLVRLEWAEVREAMVKRGWCRKLINQRWGRIVFGLRQLSEEGLVEPTVVLLAGLKSLRPGRTAAPDRPPVLSVSLDTVRATQKELNPVVRDLVELQLLTGGRPGEVRQLRFGDLVWDDPRPGGGGGTPVAIRPLRHKKAYLGRERLIPLSSTARLLLAPYLAVARGADAFVFLSPTRALPIDSRAYGKQIQAAAEKAGVPHWHPNQLRHWAATETRRLLSLDAARALLGHSSPTTTLVYAERDAAIAQAAAEALEKALKPKEPPPPEATQR